MFGRERIATRGPEGPAAASGRREPEPPADLALALQHSAGNQATGRVLARFTATNKDKYDQAARVPANVRELIDAVVGAHKSSFESRDPRQPLVAPLEQWLAVYETTLTKWEQATDADVERGVMKEVGTHMAAAKDIRTTLFAALGKGDAKKGEADVNKVLEARKMRRAAEEASKKEAADAATKKEADDKRRIELAGAFPMQAAPDAAYARQPEARIEQFREHVALTHPAFRGLSAAQLRQPTCPLYLLTVEQLQRVAKFAGAMRLSGWSEQNTPRSRQDALGFARWIVPTEAELLSFELGGEIFADWVVENHNHGFTVGKLMEIWSFLSKGGPYVKVSEPKDEDGEGTGKKVYENQLRGRTETKVVTARGDKVLITCYDTGRR